MIIVGAATKVELWSRKCWWPPLPSSSDSALPDFGLERSERHHPVSLSTSLHLNPILVSSAYNRIKYFRRLQEEITRSRPVSPLTSLTVKSDTGSPGRKRNMASDLLERFFNRSSDRRPVEWWTFSFFLLWPPSSQPFQSRKSNAKNSWESTDTFVPLQRLQHRHVTSLHVVSQNPTNYNCLVVIHS